MFALTAGNITSSGDSYQLGRRQLLLTLAAAGSITSLAAGNYIKYKNKHMTIAMRVTVKYCIYDKVCVICLGHYFGKMTKSL